MFAIVPGPLPVRLAGVLQVLDIGVVRGRLLDRRHTPVRTAIVVALALIVVEGAVGISHAKAAARSRADVAVSASRSKSRMYCRVSSRIRGLSSLLGRLCPAMTVLGFSNSTVSTAGIHSRRFCGFVSR
jgi:hypothetical protein